MADEEKKEEEKKEPLAEFKFSGVKDDYIFFESAKNAMFDAIESIEARFYHASNNANRLDTGIHCLEFDNGNLIVLAARPSIGKTSFLLSLCKQLTVDKGIPVGLINTGTIDSATLGKRLISLHCGVPMCKIRNAILKVSDLKKIEESGSKLFEAPFYFKIEPNCSFNDFVLAAESMLDEKPLKLIIIDDFEYFEEIMDAEKEDYRFELEKLMDSIKKFAVEHNIPIILGMTLPSESEESPDLLDFRKNLVIPYKADMVLFLHRDRLKEDVKVCNARLNIAKNVSGPNYEFPLKFYPATSLFEENKDN